MTRRGRYRNVSDTVRFPVKHTAESETGQLR